MRASMSRTHAAQRQQRLDWLVAHPDLWRDVPSDRDDVDEANRPTLLALLRVMTDAGLFVPTTGPTALQAQGWALRTLIGDVRRRRTLT
jgi:hypothetical protein